MKTNFEKNRKHFSVSKLIANATVDRCVDGNTTRGFVQINFKGLE